MAILTKVWLAVVAVLIGFIALIWFNVAAEQGAMNRDPAIWRARQSAELARLAQEQTDREWWSGFFRSVATGGTVLGAAVVIGWLYSQVTTPRPDSRGLLPVPRDQLADASTRTLDAYHAAQLARSRVPDPVPASVHYAPSSQYAPRITTSRGTTEALEMPALAAPAATSVPTCAALLDQGVIGPHQPLILGWSETGAITGTLSRLYTAGIGGVQGSGKSSTAAFILAQSALAGARLLVVDPHAGDPESLSNRIAPLTPAMLASVASDDKAILATLRFASDQLARRVKGSSDRWPLIVVADEWTSLLRRDALRETLPAFLADISQQGRKFGVVGMLLAQRWAGEEVGGNMIRNTLTAAYVHRMRREEARMLTGLGPTTPDDTLTLPAGSAYLLDAHGDLMRVIIPHTTGADIERVGALLSDSKGQTRPGAGTINVEEVRPPLTRRQTFQVLSGGLSTGSSIEGLESTSESTSESTLESIGQSSTTGQTLDPQDAHIWSQYVAGDDPPTIARTLTGAASGRPYTDCVKRVHEVIRRRLATLDQSVNPTAS